MDGYCNIGWMVGYIFIDYGYYRSIYTLDSFIFDIGLVLFFFVLFVFVLVGLVLDGLVIVISFGDNYYYIFY